MRSKSIFRCDGTTIFNMRDGQVTDIRCYNTENASWVYRVGPADWMQQEADLLTEPVEYDRER